MASAPGYTNPYSNWIPDENNWRLEQPPDWFLTGLYNYDEMLVIIPSRFKRKISGPQYLLARRRQYTAGLGDVAMLDNKHPDTNMCYAHKLLPIAPLVSKSGAVAFTQQNLESLLDTLRERDAWAANGGPLAKDPDAVWKAIEDFEATQQKKADASLWDKLHHMGRDAYRSLKARTGQRNKRASDYHGVAAKPPASGGVILTDTH